MKTFLFTLKQTLVLLFLIIPLFLSAQLPSVNIYTIENQIVDASTINKEKMPMVVVFFKTNEQKCCQQLFSICEKRKDDFSDKKIKVIGICMDCIGRMDHVKPFVYGNDLEIEIYIDKNGDLKREMGIHVFPSTIIYDQNTELVCKYAGFCLNSDELIADKLTECLDKVSAYENELENK